MTKKKKSTEPLFISQDSTIHSSIQEMIQQGKSCALIFNPQNEIVGIITERDLMRKIAILDLDDKLSYKVSTIMSRNIRYAHYDNLIEDIKQIHEETGFRHFPVISQKSTPTKSNIIALLTMTHLFRHMADKIFENSFRDLI